MFQLYALGLASCGLSWELGIQFVLVTLATVFLYWLRYWSNSHLICAEHSQPMIGLESQWCGILCARALGNFLAFGSSVPMGVWGTGTKFSPKVPQREINCLNFGWKPSCFDNCCVVTGVEHSEAEGKIVSMKYCSERGISWHELSTVAYIRWPIYLSSKYFTSYLTFHLSLTLSPQQFSVLPAGRICFWLNPSRIPPIRMGCMVQVTCWVAGWLLSHTTAWKMHAV